MLSVPTSLLRRWSDFNAAIPCVEALLTACLDNRPAVSRGRLDLEALHAAGWRSEAARAHCLGCCNELAQWCVANGRYAHNVAVQQDLELFFDHDLISTPLDPAAARRSGEARHPLAALVARMFPRRHVPDRPRQIGGDRVYRQRLRGDLACWSMAIRDVTDGDLVLIDAPLAATPGERGPADFLLCDYPPLLRRAHDTRVRLRVSTDAAELLAEVPGVRTGWHPFCRVLATVRQEPGGTTLEALLFQFRSPIPDEHRYNHQPAWPESLLEEVRDQRNKLMEADWLKKALPAEPQPDAQGAQASAAQAVMSAESLRAHLRIHASDTDLAITRGAGSPYEGVEALWCCLATLLPMWSEDFPLAPGDVAALLAVFDETFDEAWQRTASRLQPAVALRYTPAVMAEVRSVLAGLAAPGGTGASISCR